MILFAPLQGYTEAFYRNAHAGIIGGADEYYTPFLRLEKGGFRTRDCFDTEPERNRGVAVVPQILVRQPEEARKLIVFLRQRGYRRIDFNFACPFPKVADHGYGAGILNDSDTVRRILDVSADFPEIAFSVKLRSGARDPEDVFRLLPVWNSVPLIHIVYHPRTGEQQYRGVPDRAAFFRFAKECGTTVIYNGEIRSPEDAAEFESVMIGRGLMENPFLAREIRGEKREPRLLRDFHAELVRGCLELEQPLQKLKTLWDFLLPNAEKRLRKKLVKSRSLEEYGEAAENLLNTML